MHGISHDTRTQVSARKKRSVPLDPQVADRLPDLPSTDDAFLKLFARDPREALVQVGFVNTTDLPCRRTAACGRWLQKPRLPQPGTG